MSNPNIEITEVAYLHDKIEIKNPDVNGNIAQPLNVGTATHSNVSGQIVLANPIQIDPMFQLVKDIVFNLIMNIPGLRSKLDNLLVQPNMAIDEISRIFGEVQSKIPTAELEKLRRYFGAEHSRNSLSGILQTAFTNIMADGKIDMNDATHFMTLIYDIITLFNQNSAEMNSEVTITGEAIMYFLYFVVKCILILTLDGEEETTAVGLLDTSFLLISVAVLPITKMKCSCNPFACCFKKK